MTDTAFSTLPLHADLLSNLSSLGYSAMTPIQQQSLPDILAGKDVIAQGQTGSGKTAAFGLGLLAKLDIKHIGVQALVLCPTRELADQVAKEIRKLARTLANIKVLTLCGGMPFGPQIGSLEHGAHIIVGTPGRIEDHLSRGTLKLNRVNTLVLDEADRMLEMGFQNVLDTIIGQIPAKRQTLLFSATFPEQIKTISRRIMHKPAIVEVASTHDDSSIEQHFYKVDNDEQRMTALRLLLLQHKPESALVFCNTKKETESVAEALIWHGFSALALNGDLEQRDRDQTMVRFANKSISVLVATDVAARGLDIDSLDAVINYHIAHEPETHLHRIGRTGRAGSKGVACSLYRENPYRMTMLGDYLGREIVGEPLPPAELLKEKACKPVMTTLQIGGGKKQKLRPGDILGALTGEQGVSGSDVGKIHIKDNWSYVSIKRPAVKLAIRKLSDGKLKGRSFRVRVI
ncbi:MAG: ATP-dependent RNA helicase DbpA [Mariprofundus sp.]